MNDTDSFAMDFDPDEDRSFYAMENPMIEPPKLRVYLASPLTNADAETIEDCRMVREVTRRILEGYDYLGVRFHVYDPAEVTPPGSEHTSEEVYWNDYIAEDREEAQEAIRHRSQADGHVVTLDEWGKRYNALPLF